MTPFVVLALPRSRTYWLSHYLNYGPWQCGHDEIAHVRSLDDVRSWFAQPCTGTCETAAAPFWRLLPAGVRVVTVRRPVDEVLGSLERTGVAFDRELMRRVLGMHDRKLDQVEHRLGARRFEFAELAEERTCASLFEHCLGIGHDHDWWQRLAAINLQRNFYHMLRYLMAYAAQVEKVRLMARHEMLRRFRRPVAMDGVSFQQEDLHTAFHDGEGAMAEECVTLGEYPDAWQSMNIPLFERLEATDRLHIMTARSRNGRMCGYVVSALGEAFHGRDQVEAEQVSFFADADYPSLGRKLQHASIEDLRARGVDRVLMFQPDATRIGLLYRRLGAKQTGQRYVLELQ